MRGERVYGSLRRPGQNLRIRPLAGGGHRIEEMDEAAWPEVPDDFEVVWGDGAAALVLTTVERARELLEASMKRQPGRGR